MVLIRNASFPGRVQAPPAAQQPFGDLRIDVDAFLARHKMSATGFAKHIDRPAHFIDDLRGGMQVRPATEDRIRGFMARYDRAHK